MTPLCCHEEHAEHLADARETTRVDLTDIYRLRLEQLLEHHPVMRVLAGRDANPMCLERTPDRGVPQYIIGCRRLLNEPTLRRNKSELSFHKDQEREACARTRA